MVIKLHIASLPLAMTLSLWTLRKSLCALW